MFPWQAQDQNPKFALLLSGMDDGISVDRSALRQAGLIRLHSVSRGDRALEIIRGQFRDNPDLAVEFVICSGKLDDMGLDEFMRSLGALGSPLPVMVISDSESELATAISHGAAVTVRRPYSMNELARAVEGIRSQQISHHMQDAATGKAMRPACFGSVFPAKAGMSALRQLAATPQTHAQSAPITQNGPTRRPLAASQPCKAVERSPLSGQAEEVAAWKNNRLLWTRTALNMLRQGNEEQALELFLGALEYDPLDLEAALGLARLYQQRGDTDKSHRWQHRAGCICLTAKQYERAGVIFFRLPEKWQGDHELIEAQELLQEENFDAACEAFINICTSRKDVVLHRLLARSCQFTSAPEECIREVCAALIRSGYESTARSLAARMLREENERDWEPGGLLANFPRLQEVWAVARFTARALRAAG